MLTSAALRALIGVVVAAAIWISGYITAKHSADIQKARVETVTQVVTKTVTVTDKAATDALAAKLAAAKASEQSILSQLQEARRARPVVPDCRLPVVLRDHINDRLAATDAP